jgi:regulator of RNase E activity RraA
MKLDCKEDTIQLSPLWTGERFPDGRPKVSDNILGRIAATTVEEMWMPLYIRGYKYQFEGRLKRSNPDRDVLVGRAVTAVYMPTRPDVANYMMRYAHEAEGRKGNFNQWPLENLVKDDVVILDMYDKVREGCPLGGNLTTLIATKTEGAGAIVWGGVRDLDQIKEIKTAQFYYRDTDPTPFLETMLIGINVPCHIGMAVCMPGDVVLGTVAGVIFVPAHLAETCVIDAEKSHARDIWGFKRLHEGKYTAAQIDSEWEPEMWEDFCGWFPAASEAEPYRHLDFSQELRDSRNGIIRTFDDKLRDGFSASQTSTRW